MDPELFAETKIKTTERIRELTQEVTDELAQLWYNLYEPETVEKNIELLYEHVKTLYVDITNESVKRQNDLEKEVTRLQQEASDLQRLLHVECDSLTEHSPSLPMHSYKTKLDNSLHGLRKALKERQDEIEELLVQQNEICTELGEAERPLGYDPLPSEAQLQDFRVHLLDLNTIKEARHNDFKELRHEIRQCLDMLELETLSADDQKLIETKKVQYTKANLLRLHGIRDRLSDKCQELQRMLDQTREKVRNLWKCLETPDDERDRIEYYAENHRTAYDMWRQEFDRCETEKRANLKKFVDKVRQELLIMWEKTLKSDDEKRRFKYFTSDVYSDDLIRIHEIELEELSQFYADNESIFTLLAERKLLWARMDALEEKANAPNRFNNRGGQLLREEKERKTIAHKLPKIEQELRDLVADFEETNKRKFTVYGHEIVEMMAQEWETKRVGKKTLTARKKEPATGMTLTPGRKANTPHPSRTINSNVSTASRAAPNTTSVSTALKRKLAPTVSKDVHAKRNILGELNSPRVGGLGKTPAKKKTIASIHMAQQKRRSSGRVKSKKSMASQNAAAAHHASVSYDMFEELIAKTPSHCRSSEVHKVGGREEVTKLKTPSRIAKSTAKYSELTPLRQKSSRTMLRRLSETSDLTTPGRGMTRIPTTPGTTAATHASTTQYGNMSRVSPRNLKLSTKELPIIF